MNLHGEIRDLLLRLRGGPQGPGWEYPPDAGDSTLAAWGLQNPMVAWLLRLAPELLEWTPAELIHGITAAPRCPKERQHPMVLRIVPASGRLPRRLVWACHVPVTGSHYGGYTDCGGRRELGLYKATRGDHGIGLQTLLQWTTEGATVEYQPDALGQRKAFKIGGEQ